MGRILVVEDEALIRSELRRLLARDGHEVAEAGSVAEARGEHDLESFDLVITDLRLPGPPGTELITSGGPPVLVMTSYATVRSAVEAMKLGAVDYLSKPFDHDELLLLVDRIFQQRRLVHQNALLRQDVERAYPVNGLVGSSPPMREVLERIRKVAPTPATVLILGESGTGKELVARAVHAQSPRREAPFIAVNCAAIPDGLIESELFGHEKGAFTGAIQAQHGLVKAADGGTLFLDEIGELPLAAQARLLRLLQESEIRRVGAPRAFRVDVRVVAATHRDLPAEVSDGRFREDLYFRLRVFEIRLPPLRERGSDIRQLASFLLAKGCQRLNRSPLTLSAEALRHLEEHSWPGNVRELENALERAVILADGSEITPEHLALEVPGEPAPSEESASLVEYFKRFVLEHQDKLPETEIAKRLGISRKALWERRQRLGIPRPR